MIETELQRVPAELIVKQKAEIKKSLKEGVKMKKIDALRKIGIEHKVK